MDMEGFKQKAEVASYTVTTALCLPAAVATTVPVLSSRYPYPMILAFRHGTILAIYIYIFGGCMEQFCVGGKEDEVKMRWAQCMAGSSLTVMYGPTCLSSLGF
jgi:predicted Co/Zn/Cd cation transporter (cation efflux family)